MFKLAIKNPALKTVDTVNDFLSSNGIKHGNVITTSNIPAGYDTQLVTKSATIGHFFDQALKHSDNLYAETILNTIGLKKRNWLN